MDVREKLVELQDESDICPEGITSCIGCKYHKEYAFGNPCDVRAAIADKMISHGVMVQEWISVKDRLPEENGRYLCNVKSFAFPGCFYQAILQCDKHGFREVNIYTDDVTHWMPLPQPPKGE